MSEPDSRTPIKLTDCGDPYEASAIADALEAEGIEAIVDGVLVGFNYTEVASPPIIRVAQSDVERAAVVLEQWRADVAKRRRDRLIEQNTYHDPTTDDDLQQDRYGNDGLLWDRYGRTSIIASGLAVLLLLAGIAGGVSGLFGWMRAIARFLQ